MRVSPHKLNFSEALRTRWYWLFAFLLILLVWLLLVLALNPAIHPGGTVISQPYGLATDIENRALDLLFQLRDARRPELRDRGRGEPIVIIGIDEETLRHVSERRYNWPRSNYARLIDRASLGGATAIGLDVLLAGSSGPSAEARREDDELAQSIKQAGNVVLGEQSAGVHTPPVKPEPMFANVALATGFIDIIPDSDGFVRSARIRHFIGGEDWALSFAAHLVETHRTARIIDREIAARKIQGIDPGRARERAVEVAMREAPLTEPTRSILRCGDRLLPLRPDGRLQLDFRTRSPAFRYISAWKVLAPEAGNSTAALFKDRIVLISHTAIADQDFYPTPLFEPHPLTRLFDRTQSAGPIGALGVEIHATAIATMIDGNPPGRPGLPWQASFMIALMLLSGLGLFRLQPWPGMFIALLAAAGALAVSAWAFEARATVLPLSTAWIGLAVQTPLALALRHARERAFREETERQRAQMMDIFSRCVSPEVAETLWRKRDQVSLAGERRLVTIIFTDVRNFTPLTEGSTSEEVVEWLSDYFTRMNAIVTSRGGHISKFIGDGLMIVFGAPLAGTAEDEARAGVECGVAMLDEVEQINRDWHGTARPQLQIGVGIHTGEATCGVVGSSQRLEYTIIGDTVNVASRLESKTKDLGVPLLLSAATARLVESVIPLRSLGETDIKGKSVRIEVLTVDRENLSNRRARPCSAT